MISISLDNILKRLNIDNNQQDEFDVLVNIAENKNQKLNKMNSKNPLVYNEIVKNVIYDLKMDGSRDIYDIITGEHFDKKPLRDAENKIKDFNKIFDFDNVDGKNYWSYCGFIHPSLITDRIYVNIDNDKALDFLAAFCNMNRHLIGRNLLELKYHLPNDRADGIVIYVKKENYDEVLDSLRNIQQSRPDLFDERLTPPITCEGTGLIGMGHAQEPYKDSHFTTRQTSYNEKIEYILFDSIHKMTLDYCLKNEDIFYKCSSSIERICKAYINGSYPNISNLVSIIHKMDIMDIITLVNSVNNDIEKNADYYRIDPDNISLNSKKPHRGYTDLEFDNIIQKTCYMFQKEYGENYNVHKGQR